ncbi:DUF6191 domain-containing protein [Streptomyces sp. NPDC052396]|uniref:DUF6191 domain-containing protein n=1 Tax=Streptomyces sp. NPDC052396 TaxID=3365689 RepID=UPI0037D02D8D
MMLTSLLLMTVLVIVPFTVASARYLLRRPGRTGLGPGAAATEELHAFFNANKRVQQEQRRVDLLRRDNTEDGAPPRMGIDLEAGTARIRRG